jgi:hypothetical protein
VIFPDYLFRNAIEVDPTARYNLTAGLVKGLLEAKPVRGRELGRMGLRERASKRIN